MEIRNPSYSINKKAIFLRVPLDRFICFSIGVNFCCFGMAISSFKPTARPFSFKPNDCCDKFSTDFERRFNMLPNGVRGLSSTLLILFNRLVGVGISIFSVNISVFIFTQYIVKYNVCKTFVEVPTTGLFNITGICQRKLLIAGVHVFGIECLIEWRT